MAGTPSPEVSSNEAVTTTNVAAPGVAANDANVTVVGAPSEVQTNTNQQTQTSPTQPSRARRLMAAARERGARFVQGTRDLIARILQGIKNAFIFVGALPGRALNAVRGMVMPARPIAASDATVQPTNGLGTRLRSTLGSLGVTSALNRIRNWFAPAPTQVAPTPIQPTGPVIDSGVTTSEQATTSEISNPSINPVETVSSPEASSGESLSPSSSSDELGLTAPLSANVTHPPLAESMAGNVELQAPGTSCVAPSEQTVGDPTSLSNPVNKLNGPENVGSPLVSGYNAVREQNSSPLAASASSASDSFDQTASKPAFETKQLNMG